MIRIFWVLTIVLLLSGCSGSVPSERLLFDFELDSELDNIHWKCHTLLSLSDKNVTHGGKSLMLEMYPSDYPGWSPVLIMKDWQGFHSLCFDIFNPQEKEIRITVRIDDKDESPDYNDRYNRSFAINPGMNHMEIPLGSLLTSGTRRKMDLKKIHRFLIFMVKPDKKITLYMDYVRLVS